MDRHELEELLNNESFVNYCLHKKDEDVQYWQKWIAEHPEVSLEVKKLRVTVIALAQVTADRQANAQYTKLQQRIGRSAVVRPKATSYTRWYSAAASLLLLVAVGSYFFRGSNRASNNYTYNKLHDIAPGANKALLTLADGKKLDLTSAHTGVLLDENGIRVSKKADGQIVYQADPNTSLKGSTTIQTPAKGQYMVILPDGTKVWLNAKTTLTYPAAFASNSRQVELAGEAYFEVAHVSDRHTGERVPFVVKTSSPQNPEKAQEVEVLGTHFNINCYADEPTTVTTLLEGRVKVTRSAQNKGLLLKPGEEAVNGDDQFAVEPANTEAALAWQKGDFYLHEDVSSALRKISRWYDVDIAYQPGAPKHLMLGGWISRKNNISEVLNMMEATGKIHLKIEGRRIIVTD